MINYDFLVLSPDEFENFSRDLLQKVRGILFESFTNGRDGGIDFRYGTAQDRSILQCKRYKHYSDLISTLKKEAAKVLKLAPKRYILVTTVGLTPPNKEEIKSVFLPFEIADEDIVGSNDLNNFLGLHKEIERKYYKLWIASTNILERILHSRVINQSELERERILKNIELYVQNDSFTDALDILKQNRFVLISGIPGIGKTTLARFLVYYLLGDNIEEFVYLSDSIDDAYATLNTEKSQVFLFDDFLGKRNFLKANLKTNEDRRIVDFIDLVAQSKNKYLIFTTREYVLRQAQSELETLGQIDPQAKCIVDLKKYNKIARGKILYNHLFFLGLPHDHIANLVVNRLFLKLVDHKNYSPRLIESVTKRKFWETINPAVFGKTVLGYFENPQELWKHAYESQISAMSKIALAVMATTDTPLLVEDIERSLQEFSKSTSGQYFNYTYFELQKTLHELEDTFISIQKDSRDNLVVTFQNPSIHDFMCQYLTTERRLIHDVIVASVFFNQLVVSFTANPADKTRIFLSKELEKIIVEKMIREYDYLGLSVLMGVRSTPDGFHYRRISSSDILKIVYLVERVSIDEYEGLKQFLKPKLASIEIEQLQNQEIESFLRAMTSTKSEFGEDFDYEQLLRRVFVAVAELEDLDYFYAGYRLHNEAFQRFIEDDATRGKIDAICTEAFEMCSSNEMEDLKHTIESISSQYSQDFDDLISDIDNAIIEHESQVSEHDMSDDYRELRDERVVSEDDKLVTMFEGLLTAVES